MLVSVHNGGIDMRGLKTYQAGQGEVNIVVGTNITMFYVRFFIKYQFARRFPRDVANPGIISRVKIKG
jgi:hypothetical protein